MPITFRATITVDDDEAPALAAALGLTPAPTGSATVELPPTDTSERELDVELPSRWRALKPRRGETYTWPQGVERYDPFIPYEGVTSRGAIELAIGRCRRARVWGRDRIYLVTFHVTEGGKQPLCEFLETDDYEDTRELVAIIRGTGASQRGMYDPQRVLPGAYRRLRTVIYRDYIRADRSWNRQAVLAHENDVETMLAHTLIQADHRFGIRPR